MSGIIEWMTSPAPLTFWEAVVLSGLAGGVSGVIGGAISRWFRKNKGQA